MLDAGCGLGENAIHLAETGHQVTGVDASAVAVAQAGERARAQGVHVEFAVADATELAGYEGRFDTVVDSALYHCLPEHRQRPYLAALHGATRPDARLHLLCVSDAAPEGTPPSRVSAANLRANLAATGWLLDELAERTITAAIPADLISGLGLATDDQGYVRVAAWLVRAVRQP